MKKFIFIAIFFIVGNLHARQVVLDIPDTDIKIVEHDVPDAEEWLKNAWAGKLFRCKERLAKQEVDRSLKNAETIPAGLDAVVQKAFLRPDYKSRKDMESGK